MSRLIVSVVLVAISIVSIGSSTATAAEPWPTDWAPFAYADTSPLLSVGGNTNPGYTDLWSGAGAGTGALPTSYWSGDGTTLWFRIRVREDPEVSRGGSFNSSVWLVEIATGGVHQVSIGLNGKPAGAGDEVYVASADGAVLTTIYLPVAPDGSASGGGRVVADGIGGFFVDFQVPMAAVTAVAPTVTPSAPVQLFAGSSTNTNNINKDFIAGDEVNFDGLAVVTLDGLPTDTSTFVDAGGPTLTNDSTPTIGGTGEPGSTVVVTVDDQTITTTVDPAGIWTVDVPVALPDDTYLVTAVATDAAGNTATDTLDMTVDTITTVGVTEPAFTDDPTPTINGTGEPGATVVVTVGDQTLTTTVDPAGSWSVGVPVALADATYPVTAVATDTAGNTATNTLDMTVDTSTFVTVTSDALTNDSTPTIGGTGEPGATIVVTIGGQTITTTVAPDGTWTIDVPIALDDNTYPATVTATDTTGNVATDTLSITVDTITTVGVTEPAFTDDPTPTINGTGEPGATVVVTVGDQTLTTTVDPAGSWSVGVPVALADATYPVTAVATDTAGNTATNTLDMTVDTSTFVTVTSDALTNDSTPTIGGTGEPGATIVVTIGGQTITTTVAPDGTWTIDVPIALDDNTYPATVTATDTTGNVATDTLSITVDTITVVDVVAPSQTTNATPTITGTGEPGATVVVTVDDQTLTTTVDPAGSWSVGVPVALADATYPVTAVATDTAGNTATNTLDMTVDTSTFVTVTSDALTNDSTPTIGGTGEPGATIVVTIGGQTITTTVAPDGTWTIDVPIALDDNTYPATVTATDTTGNVATDTLSITVDTITVVDVVAPSQTTNATPTITGTGEPGATVVVTVDDQTLTTTVDPAGSWSVGVPIALADATYPVTAVATDTAGNTATDTADMTVDTTTFVAIETPALTTDPTPTIGGTSEPDATIVVTIGGQTITTTVAPDGTWTIDVPIALDDNTYPATVTATDTQGNTATTTQNITIDATTAVDVVAPSQTTNATPTITGTGEPGATIVVTVDDQTLTTTVDPAGSWSVGVPIALDDNTYPVTAVATDTAGNTATDTADMTVDTTTFVAIETPALTTDPTPTIGGTSEPDATIVVTIGGQTITTTVAPDGTWTIDVPIALDDNTYPATVTATDTQGNTATTTQNITIDTTTDGGSTPTTTIEPTGTTLPGPSTSVDTTLPGPTTSVDTTPGPTTSVAMNGGAPIPATGNENSTLLLIAVLLLLGGTAVMLTARRRIT